MKPESSITALALTHNRRFLAVAESFPKLSNIKPQIVIYDLIQESAKRNKILNFPQDFSHTHEGIIEKIVYLDFSHDGKYLIAQGSEPTWILSLWLWDKHKLVSHIKSTNPSGNEIKKVTFSPYDSTQICVTGDQIFKLFRFTEGHLKLHGAHKFDPKNLTGHAWLTHVRVALISDEGMVYVLENGDVKDVIDLRKVLLMNMPKHESHDTDVDHDHSDHDDSEHEENGQTEETDQKVACTSILAISNGFVLSDDSGLTTIFEAIDSKIESKRNPLDTYKHLYRLIDSIHLPLNNLHSTDYIINFQTSPTGEILVALTNKHELYQYNLGAAKSENNSISYWESIDAGSHSSSILDITACSRKPLIASCSSDSTLKIWNYETKQAEISKKFTNEQIFSVSLHPSGLHILVGFSDKLRLMNLLIDDLRLFKEFPIRGCKLSQFSNGGHLFAVVHGFNILIYNFSKFEIVSNLQGHSHKISSLSWSPNDMYLVTCGADGAIYQWDAVKNQRVYEVVKRSRQYTSAIIDQNEHIWAASIEGDVEEILNNDVLRIVHLEEPLLCLALCGDNLYGTTSNGHLRVISKPLMMPCEYKEFRGHSKSAPIIISTKDNNNVISASLDGSIIVWDTVLDKTAVTGGGGPLIEIEKNLRKSNWTEEVLVSRSDLEDKNNEILELKTIVDELKMENEYQLKLKDMNHEEKTKDLTEKFIQELEELGIKNSFLRNEKENNSADFEAEIYKLNQTQDKAIIKLEQDNNKKLMFEYERYQELQAKTIKLTSEYERKLQDLEDCKQAKENEWEARFEDMREKLSQEILGKEDEICEIERAHEEFVRELEEDADGEILEMKVKYEKRLKEAEEYILQLKGENAIKDRKRSALTKDLKEMKYERHILTQDKEKLNGVIKNLEKDIQVLRKDIKERDETLTEKESVICELKKKNMELEKFKFVLDYKIKELKKQIEPRELDIKNKKEQIEQMELELETFFKANEKLDLDKSNLKLKLKAQDSELKIQKQKVKDYCSLLKTLAVEMNKCANMIQDVAGLKKAVVGLHAMISSKKYVNFIEYGSAKVGSSSSSSSSKSSIGPDGASSASSMNELDTKTNEQKANELMYRQKEHLEKSLSTLRAKANQATQKHKNDHRKIMQENVHLISEINELRKELKNCRLRISDLEKTLGIKAGVRSKKGGVAGASGSSGSGVNNINKDFEKRINLQMVKISELEGVVERQRVALEGLGAGGDD